MRRTVAIHQHASECGMRRVAYEHLSAAGRANVWPLVILGQGQYSDTKPPRPVPKKPRKNAPLSASDALAKQVLDAWGTASIYLDASDLIRNATSHHLDSIAASARSAGLSVIPATRLGVPTAYELAIRRMVSADCRGVALRISLAEMTGAATWFPTWKYGPSDTDL
jgi:hypothetical protein